MEILIKNGSVFTGDRIIPADVLVRDGAVYSVQERLRTTGLIWDAPGCYVCPGLIDLHTHVYPYAVPYGIDHRVLWDSGATVFCDAGSTGVHNFLGFKHHVIRPAKAHLYAWLHVCVNGLTTIGVVKGVGELDHPVLVNNDAAEKLIEENEAFIIGVKVRLDRFCSPAWQVSLKDALDLAYRVGMPLMVHIAGGPPDIDDVLEALRPGDIVSHYLRPEPNSIFDGGQIKRSVLAARDRGVLFDVAHGKGSFSFDTARKAFDLGFLPDIISSDIHSACYPRPAYGLIETMSKMYALGMSIEQILPCVTTMPAGVAQLPHGTICVGGPADITIIEPVDEPHVYHDRATSEILPRRLIHRATFIGGEQVFHNPALSAESIMTIFQ